MFFISVRSADNRKRKKVEIESLLKLNLKRDDVLIKEDLRDFMKNMKFIVVSIVQRKHFFPTFPYKLYKLMRMKCLSYDMCQVHKKAYAIISLSQVVMNLVWIMRNEAKHDYL